MEEKSSGRVGQTIQHFFEGLFNYFIFLPYFFSVPTLLLTLFKPWKNLLSKKKEAGFSFNEWIEKISFNLVSRTIGFLMRFFTLVIFLICELTYVVLLPVVILLFFVFLPLRLVFILFTPSEEAQKTRLRQTFVSKHILQTENQRLVEQWFENLYQESNYHKQWWKLEHLLSTPPIARDWAVGYTPTLDKYTANLTDVSYQARLKNIVDRQEEIKEIEQALSKSEETNILIVGEAGVGKQTIIDAFAKKIYEGRSNTLLNYKRVLVVNFEAILTEYTDAQQREHFVEELLQEASESRSVILVINNFERYVSGGGPNHVDLSNAIEKVARGSSLQIVGITTPFHFEKYIFSNATIMQLFTKIAVEEISDEKALAVLLELAPSYEQRYHLTIPYETLKNIIDESEFYITNIPFPEKAIELLDNTSSYGLQQKKERILPDDVENVLSRITHVPTKLDQATKKTLLDFESILSSRIIAQDTAIQHLSTALRRSFLLLGKRKKPLASFLFLGPTGVGKTETAKVLADVFFHDESRLLRFDMSLYQSKEDIPALIGSMESNNPGLLTQAIRTNPYSVLLLDEIEKAHKDLLNIFLTVFDEGYYTDGFGKRVDAKNLIIIVTSNAGSDFIFNKQLQTSDMINFLVEKHYFSPEFLNRFDGVIAFSPLDENGLLRIGKTIVNKLEENYQKLHKITVSISDQTLIKLIYTLQNKEFGARNLERAITQEIEDKIDKQILTGNVKEGATLEF